MLTTYDVSLVTADWVPVVEETNVTPARLVELMRRVLTSSGDVSHQVLVASSCPHADGMVSTLKCWLIEIRYGVEVEWLNLVVGTVTRSESQLAIELAQLKLRERLAWNRLVVARSVSAAHASVGPVAVAEAALEHAEIVSEINALQTAMLRARVTTTPAPSGPLVANTRAERLFDRTDH